MSDVPWWASDDPFALSPDEQADHDARRARREAAMAALPDDPPLLGA